MTEQNEFLQFQGTAGYIASASLVEAVNAAIALERPLLTKGEPGTGKTLLAEHIAQGIGLPIEKWHIKSTSKAHDGLYVYAYAFGDCLVNALYAVYQDNPDGFVEMYFDMLRAGGTKPHRELLAPFERLRREGQRFKLKSVLMSGNRHEIEGMRALAESYGVDFYFDSAIFPCLPHGDNAGHANRAGDDAGAEAPASVEVAPPSLDRPLALRVSPEEAAAAQLSDQTTVRELADLYLRTKDIPDNDRLYVCGAGQTTFHVDPYGNLQPCTISTNVNYNIREGGFLEGWNGPVAAIREIRRSADNSCRSCDKQALCSGCPAMSFAEHGAGDQKSDYICRTTHALFDGIEGTVSDILETSP